MTTLAEEACTAGETASSARRSAAADLGPRVIWRRAPLAPPWPTFRSGTCGGTPGRSDAPCRCPRLAARGRAYAQGPLLRRDPLDLLRGIFRTIAARHRASPPRRFGPERTRRRGPSANEETAPGAQSGRDARCDRA